MKASKASKSSKAAANSVKTASYTLAQQAPRPRFTFARCTVREPDARH